MRRGRRLATTLASMISGSFGIAAAAFFISVLLGQMPASAQLEASLPLDITASNTTHNATNTTMTKPTTTNTTMPMSANRTRAAAANATTYDPAKVVANITADCPVANIKYTPEEFSTSSLISTLGPMISSAPRSNCTSQAQSLASCAFDGSLTVKSGCCSTACSERMAKLRDQKCIPEILALGCNATAAQWKSVQRFLPVLLSAATRCVGYQVNNTITCPNGKVVANAAPGANTTSTLNSTTILGAPAATVPAAAAPAAGPLVLGSPGEDNLSTAANETGLPATEGATA